MPHDQTEVLTPDALGISRAVEILSAGWLVAMPTETVYGLAGNATDDMACARIFDAKGRPRFNPLIVHMPSLAAAKRVAIVSPEAEELAAQFWPGPLTLVLPLKEQHGLSSLITAGLDTVAVRVPAHSVAQALLAALPFPLAAPSANPSGQISPTHPDHVRAGLTGKVAAILDGGPSVIGLESTILAPGRPTRLLREGGLAREEIEQITGPLIEDKTPGKVQAPGQLSSHYAPHTHMVINSALDQPDTVRIGFGHGKPADLSFSPSGNLIEAAANLFAILHKADDLAATSNRAEIHVAPIPDHGLGRAINDRLTRAAAPRS